MTCTEHKRIQDLHTRACHPALPEIAAGECFVVRVRGVGTDTACRHPLLGDLFLLSGFSRQGLEKLAFDRLVWTLPAKEAAVRQ